MLLSKSTESLIRLWKPNPARKPDAAMILREFKVDDANIWFVRFEHDPYCQRLVCGNQSGRVFLFNIFESDEIGVTRSQELTHLKNVTQLFDTLHLVQIESASLHAATMVRFGGMMLPKVVRRRKDEFENIYEKIQRNSYMDMLYRKVTFVYRKMICMVVILQSQASQLIYQIKS